MKSYQETIDYLFNIAPAFENIGKKAYKADLHNSIALDKHFGNPHKQFKSIHIAGTNGKGSCSHTLAAILQSAGYKVGLYTSPHLVDFRERIRVNGESISADYVIDFVEQQRPYFEPLKPSFFEVTTALAFKYFAEMRVDYAVIEVGLGGRLDCTNIISPCLSVITNISFDHTDLLGDTLSAIANEKAGIIKERVPVVIGETTAETRAVFEERARQKNAPITFAEDDEEVLASEQTAMNGMTYSTKHFGKIHSPMGGTYQVHNTNTILTAVKELEKQGVISRKEAVAEGFLHVKELTNIAGRWQYLGTKPTIVCDTGHNMGGWKYLAEQIKAQPCQRLRIVFGMVNDKDVNAVMALLPKNATYYFTRANTKRALSETVVQSIGVRLGLQGDCFPDVKTAFEQAKSDANADDFIFIGGSSYIVSDLFLYLKGTPTRL